MITSRLRSSSFAWPVSHHNDDRALKSLRETPFLAKEDSSSNGSSAIGLYVHIPFCRRRCRYCNFAIVPIGPRAFTEDIDLTDSVDQTSRQAFLTLSENYTCAVLSELDWIAAHQLLNEDKGNNEKIALRSIYFGGGTPSLASTKTLETILSAILDPTKSPFTVHKYDCEITIEMDPGTFSKDKLRAIKNMGFNRISLGVQSFDDFILESLGRVHRSIDIYESLAMIQEVYGDSINYSLDLITGLPGQSLANWVETLETAVNLQPRPVHLSVYDLQIEQGTVFGNWYDRADEERSHRKTATFQSTRGETPKTSIQRQQQVLRLPSAEEAAFMYKYTSGYLRSKGFEHYEVSSYALQTDNALTSYRSQHNQIYWDQDGQWYAVGLGATSFVNGRITERPRTLADYHRWVDRLEHNENGDDDKTGDVLDSKLDFLTDHVLKRLRTSEGLSLDWVLKMFGSAHRNAIVKGAELGIDLHLAFIDESNRLRLKDPDGFLYSNSIISSIFVELEKMPP